jgi:hypothetical protein
VGESAQLRKFCQQKVRPFGLRVLAVRLVPN